jgi:hypothetical protein
MRADTGPMGERNVRRWRLLHRHRDPVIPAEQPAGEAVIYGAVIGVVFVVIALALFLAWAILRFAGLVH